MEIELAERLRKWQAELEEQVMARILAVPLLNHARFRFEPLPSDVCEELTEGTSASLVAGVIVNGDVAIALNHWGYKPGQVSYLVFERTLDGGWDHEPVAVSDNPTWRNQCMGGRSQALDGAIVLAIRTLIERVL